MPFVIEMWAQYFLVSVQLGVIKQECSKQICVCVEIGRFDDFDPFSIHLSNNECVAMIIK